MTPPRRNSACALPATTPHRILNRAAALLFGAASLLMALTALMPKALAEAPANGDARYTSVELPLVTGWFEGTIVQYVTIDVSVMAGALKDGANYVPKLANAIPPLPHTPGQDTALDRIYTVTNFRQPNILPSIPLPTGPANADRSYSPLWQIHQVTWLPGAQAHELRSEEALLDAAEKKWLSIVATDIVANCPVVYSAQGGILPGAKMLARIDPGSAQK